MTLSKCLARPMATLVHSNRPVLRRYLHQPSDPRQSRNQEKASDTSDAGKDSIQGPPGTREDPSPATQRGSSNTSSSTRPKPYKTRPWVRALIAMGMNSRTPAQKGGSDISSSGGDGNNEAAAKADSAGSVGSSKPPSGVHEALDKLLQNEGHANPEGRKRTLNKAFFIKTQSGSHAKSGERGKEALDEILREKYGIEDVEKRKRIIQNSRTVEVNVHGLVLSLILTCLVAAIVYLQLKERDHLSRLREKEIAKRQKEMERENSEAEGQYTMMDGYTKLGDTGDGQVPFSTRP